MSSNTAQVYGVSWLHRVLFCLLPGRWHTCFSSLWLTATQGNLKKKIFSMQKSELHPRSLGGGVRSRRHCISHHPCLPPVPSGARLGACYVKLSFTSHKPWGCSEQTSLTAKGKKKTSRQFWGILSSKFSLVGELKWMIFFLANLTPKAGWGKVETQESHTERGSSQTLPCSCYLRVNAVWNLTVSLYTSKQRPTAEDFKPLQTTDAQFQNHGNWVC